jgi:DNA (cytosine-5)-methyltransferase 1
MNLLDNKKIDLNNMTDISSNITCIIEEMDLTELSKKELLEKCEELGIKKCKSKNKGELIELINSKKMLVEEDKTNDNNIILEVDDNDYLDNPDKKYKVLSLFTGICGMDMGFCENIIVHKKSIANDFKDNIMSIYEKYDNFVILQKKNFEVVFQNDILEGAKKVCDLNKISHNYNTTSIYTLIENNFNFPNADIVIGGFPCNDFSHAGKREGFNSSKSHNLKDEANNTNNRGTLYKSFVKVVEKVKPKIFIAENVYGLLTMKNEPIKQIVDDFENLGYDVNYQLIKANEYGIPQKRWRVIIMGISKQRNNNLLEENWNYITKNKISCSVKNYLQHLLEPDESEDISQQVFSKAQKLDKGQGQIEIDLNDFAPTIRAEHHGNIEFRRHKNGINKDENHLPERRLTVREAGLIQTFPPDFIFNTKKNMTSYKYIGNAVPPLLSYIIADKVNELLTNYF